MKNRMVLGVLGVHVLLVGSFAVGSTENPASRTEQVMIAGRELTQFKGRLQGADLAQRLSIVSELLRRADEVPSALAWHRENLLDLASQYSDLEQGKEIQRSLHRTASTPRRRAYAALQMARLARRLPAESMHWSESCLALLREHRLVDQARAMFEEAVLVASDAAERLDQAERAFTLRATLYEGPESRPESDQAAYAMVENARASFRQARATQGRNLLDRMLTHHPRWGHDKGWIVSLLLERARAGVERPTSEEYKEAVRSIWENPAFAGLPESLLAGLELERLESGNADRRAEAILSMLERAALHRERWQTLEGPRHEGWTDLRRQVLIRGALLMRTAGRESLILAACDEFLAAFPDDHLSESVRERRASIEARLLSR